MSGAEGKAGVGIYPPATSKPGQLKRKQVFYLFLYVSATVRSTPTAPDPIAEQVYAHCFQDLQHYL